jgi:hypothetical protein
MGSKGGSTQQTSTSSGPPPQVMAEYQGLVDRATNVANQPYQPYQGEMVAPLTPQTQAGLGGISQYAGAAQPYLGAAGAMTMGASAPVNPSQFMGMGSLAPFMNPYTSSVVGTTEAEMNNQNQQQAQFLNSANISSGAFGGDRAGIGQSILANQQQLAEAPTIAGLNQANFNQAMSNWQNQQGVNLAAQQANAARQLSGAAQLGSIGLSAQSAGMQGAQAETQAGMIPQQEQQLIDQAAQNMYQTGQAYPFTTTGWLGNIVEGVGGQSGGTSQTTSPAPNTATQMLGAGMQGLGLLSSWIPGLSDERAKENIEEIGKTYDGQNIYRYNFRGDPRTQIGLIAQEEAYHDPGSVYRVGIGDLLGIDYEGATDEAAERGHYAGGGGADTEGEFDTPYWPGHPHYPGPFAQKPVTYDEHGNPEFPPVVEPEEQRWSGGRIGFQEGGGPPPGGVTQGVTQGAGGAQPPSQNRALSPDYALMMMGQGGARMGLGSMGLAGGTKWPGPASPNPGFEEIPLRPPPSPQDQGPSRSGLATLGGEMPPVFPPSQQGRQSFQGGGTPITSPEMPIGPNGQFGYSQGWAPGDALSGTAGVSEALFGEESAGSKHPYTGIDIDQINAIGSGQWMPPVTNSPMPNWQDLGTSPQFGAAEASLAGPYSGTGSGAVAPSAGGGMGPPAIGGAPIPGGAGATYGGLSRGGLGNIANQYFGGGAGGGGTLGQAGGVGGGGYTPGKVPPGTATLSSPAPAAPAAAPAAPAPIVQNNPQPVALHPGLGGPASVENLMRGGGGRVGEGGVNVNDNRPGFQSGGGYYVPTTGNARGPATWVPGPQPAPPPAIAIQRHLQGQARARAAVARGIVRPRVIAHDPVTGQPHDITPQGPLHDRPPFGTGPYSDDPPMPPLRSTTPISQSPISLRQGPGWADPTVPSSRGPGMGYPAAGILPPEELGGPEDVGGRVGYRGPPRSTMTLTVPQQPLQGEPEWPRPSTNVQEPIDSSEFSEHSGGRPLMAPRLVGADPYGQQHNLLGPHQQALAPPSGDEAPMFHSDVDVPGIFHGGGQGFMNEAHGGRVPRWGGGRLGFQDGGDAGGLSNADWSIFDTTGNQGPGEGPGHFEILNDEARSPQWHPDPDPAEWTGKPDFSQLSDDTFNLFGGRPQRAQVDPRAVARAPTFGGGGGGQGGGGYRGIVTSLMGGPPITAGDFGHYIPTTGNAQGPATWVPGAGGGAGAISPNARAQAPEHPAITMARHILRSRGAGQGRSVYPDPTIAAGGPGAPLRDLGPEDPSIIAHQKRMSPMPDDPGAAMRARLYHKLNPTGSPIGVAPMRGGASGGYQGGGGVIGSSPLQNAGGYTPQGFGMSGRTSQGEGLGSFATSKAASGFGDLFGGGSRAGFQMGGNVDPFLAAITSSVPQGGGGRAPTIPEPPKPPTPPSGEQPGSPGDLMKKLGSLSDQWRKGSQQTAPTGEQPVAPVDQAALQGLDYSAADTSAINAATSGDLFTGALDPSNFTDSQFFQTGGGVGLGALRGGFQAGGDAADAPSAFDLGVTGAAPPVAAAEPAKGGGGAPAVPDLINQNFGERAGYASTISRLESGMGKNYVGDDNSSFGPFQLHMGGISEKYPHSGLGDEFRHETGLDPRDPKTVPDQVKFVANYTAKHGWNDWSTKSQADKIAGGANVPSAAAMPASASTEAYGGGFTLPGPQPQPTRAPTMGDELRRDPGGWLMTVGAGMMASRSPWLGVGIGEGLVAGNKYLGQMQNLEKEWNLNQAQINNFSAEAREHDADAGLKLNQLQISRVMTKMIIDRARQRYGGAGAGDGTGAPSATGAPGAGGTGLQPVQPLGGGTAASGAPGGGAAAPAAAVPAAAPSGGMAGADYTKDPDYIRGMQMITQGTSDKGVFHGTPLEGDADAAIAQGNALVEGAKNRAGIQKTIGEKTTEAEIEAKKPALQEYVTNRQKFESTYDQTRSEIGELSTIYQHAQSGRSAEAQAELASWANAFGFKLPQAASFDAGMKSAIQQAFAAVANSGLQKAPRAGLREATMMVASPTRDPAALRKILTDQLATLDYQHDMYSNVPGHNLNVDDDLERFTKEHKYEDYLKKARKEVPLFQGITPETLKNVTGEDWPAPPLPANLPAGTKYSPSQNKFYDPSGRAYDQTGKPV